MVLTELCPESWMRATCTVSCCSDRCQGASAREGTNYRTAAQQTLTLPWGQCLSHSLVLQRWTWDLAPLLPIPVHLHHRRLAVGPQGSYSGSPPTINRQTSLWSLSAIKLTAIHPIRNERLWFLDIAGAKFCGCLPELTYKVTPHTL